MMTWLWQMKLLVLNENDIGTNIEGEAVSILHQWLNNTIKKEDTSINVDIDKDFKIATE